MEFIQDLKDKGWKIFRDDDGEWNHVCPDCQE